MNIKHFYKSLSRALVLSPYGPCSAQGFAAVARTGKKNFSVGGEVDGNPMASFEDFNGAGDGDGGGSCTRESKFDVFDRTGAPVRNLRR